jgi:transcription-repair coupling factor (superfamily II helicase)
VIYKRLALCTSEADLLQIQEELIDRFGLLPQPAKTLVMSHHLRLLAKPIGVLKLDASDEAITIQFAAKNKIDPMRVIQLIQSKPRYKLAGQDKLRVEIALPDVFMRVAQTKALLQELVE